MRDNTSIVQELILHVKDRAPEITETQKQNTDRETQTQHTQNHPGSPEGDQDLEEDLKPESAEVKTEPKLVGEKEHQENNAISLPQVWILLYKFKHCCIDLNISLDCKRKDS